MPTFNPTNNVDYSVLIFVHIEKTAGTTLKKLLTDQYGEDHIFLVAGEEAAKKKYLNLSEKSKNQIRVIMGHMTFSWNNVIKKQCSYITLLRHPVERIISSYYHILRSGPHHLGYDQVISEKLSLEEYVQKRVVPSVDNGQVRALCGLPDAARTDIACDENMFKLAKHNLVSFFAWGLTERFDESIRLFEQLFGWKSQEYQHENVGPNRPSSDALSENTLDILRAHNHYDIELYNYAFSQFDNQLKSLPNQK